MEQGKSSIFDAVKDLAAPFLDRNQEDEPSDGYCYLHAPKHMERVDPQTFEVARLLRQHSELGGRIFDQAERKKVKFLRTEMRDNFRGSNLGKVIKTSPKNSLIEDTNVLPHELMHWVQPDTNIRHEWDVRTWLLATLAMESGAATCAARITHEMHENGYSDSFNEFAHGVGGFFVHYRPLYRLYDETKQKSLQSGRDHKDAVLDAGDATFHEYFDRIVLIRAYGSQVLESYVDNATSIHYPIPGYGTKAAKNQTKISYDEYLVRKANLPLDDADLFKKNKTLRQAFDYAELIHVYNYCNQKKTNLAVKRKIQSLEIDENPFLGVDLIKAFKEFQSQDNDKPKINFLGVMKDMAGISKNSDQQLSLDL